MHQTIPAYVVCLLFLEKISAQTRDQHRHRVSLRLSTQGQMPALRQGVPSYLLYAEPATQHGACSLQRSLCVCSSQFHRATCCAHSSPPRHHHPMKDAHVGASEPARRRPPARSWQGAHMRRSGSCGPPRPHKALEFARGKRVLCTAQEPLIEDLINALCQIPTASEPVCHAQSLGYLLCRRLRMWNRPGMR
jgi:hypothetical protein